MHVNVRLLLRDGHVGEFCCDEHDSTLFELISALPGAEAGANLPPDGLIQIDARGCERLVLPRSSLVAVQVSPKKRLFIEHSDRERESKTKRASTHCQQTSALIDYAVITVPRPEEYIHQLISSVRPDLPLRLVVGSPERDYLKKYASNSRIEVIETTQAEWDRFQDYSIHQRAGWNYWRALTLGSRSSNPKGLVIFEDDVVPIYDWESRLYRLIEQIEAHGAGPYILSLYAAAESGLKAPDDGNQYVSYPPDNFFGSQAIYYPEPVRERYSRYLKKHVVDAFSMPHDLVLSGYSKKENVPIFAAIPCLVQHIGEVSTGLAGFFHQAIQL